jgi:phosphatidate cytidylyltransferase
MKRILTALILTPLFIYLVGWAPQWAFLVSTALVAVLCFWEYSGLVARHNIEPPGIFGYASGLVLLFIPLQQTGFLVMVGILAMALALRWPEMNRALPYAGALVLGIIYTFGTLRCAIDLRVINPYWTLLALSLNWVGDIAALYIGRSIGRHKLAPHASPGKTWEGSIGSVLASVLYAAIYCRYLLPEVPLPEVLLIAAAGNVAGQIGDLSESVLKRGAGVKDSGSFLPGHGGWLDRVDSSLFALPVVYFLVTTIHSRA